MQDPHPAGVRSVDFGVVDVAAAARFYTQAWRLAPAAQRDGAVYLRGVGPAHHLLALHPRPRAVLLGIDLAAADRGTVDALHDRARRAGARVQPPAPLDEPGGGYAFALRDPEGRRVRVVAGDARQAPLPDPADRPWKITHVVLNAPDPEASARFWCDALGFVVSDRSRLTFLRCSADHHSLAFHPGASATLHHVAFEMPDLDAVMRGAGRLRRQGHPVEWGIGRHGPGNNVFAYFVGPEDFVVEYTAEVLQVDERYRARAPEAWVYPPGTTDLWGFTPPPSARMLAAQERIAFAADG
jgi:catechol-2,3-dioxygenase